MKIILEKFRSKNLLGLLLVLSVGIILRLYNLNTVPLGIWYDEACIVNIFANTRHLTNGVGYRLTSSILII